MTVHIDDWGTRRQYTSKVVQGTGGGGGSEPGGNVITATIDQSVANAVAAHEAKTDPHRQYITAAKLAAALAGQRCRSYFISQI